jgi:hypothetical protein
MNTTLPELFKPVMALENQTNAGALTGDYVKASLCHMLYIVVSITQGAANTCALTIEQATTAGGGSTKAITNTVPIWSNLDTAASDTLTRRTDAVSYTTDAGVKNKIVIFQIDPSSLDTENEFDWITVKCGASNAGNIVGAMYFFGGLRYADSAPPTQIA